MITWLHIYMAILGASTLLCLVDARKAPTASKLILVLMIATTVAEAAGLLLYHAGKSNRIVYTIFNPIQFLLIAAYYNYTVNNLRHGNRGLIIGLAGMVIGVCNYFVWPERTNANSIFLLFESVSVIALSLYSLYNLILYDDNLDLVRHPHFWLTTLFLFFWFVTFMIWGLRDLVHEHTSPNDKNLLSVLLLCISMMCYPMMAILFHKSLKSGK